MVENPMLRVCIDRYEASIWDSPSAGSGMHYGKLSDDFPSGFPDLVDSVDCSGQCLGEDTETPTLTLYALSVADVLPSRQVTWFQAKRACENSGKRLCTAAEWGEACSRTGMRVYPYGDTYDADRCNSASTDAVVTGSYDMCEGGYDKLFDMFGNLKEWTSTCDTSCNVYGGHYAASMDQFGCTERSSRHAPADDLAIIGFRCCSAVN